MTRASEADDQRYRIVGHNSLRQPGKSSLRGFGQERIFMVMTDGAAPSSRLARLTASPGER